MHIKNKIDGQDFDLEMFDWTLVTELKGLIEKYLKIPRADQRLFYKNVEINQNNASVDSFGIRQNSKITLQPTRNLEGNLGLIENYDIDVKKKNSKKIDETLRQVREAFRKKIKPKPTDSGTSGSYFLENIDR